MAATKHGIDGGIAPAGLTGPISQAIGLATETDAALGVSNDSVELVVTALGISGGIGNGVNDFTGKVRILGQPEETDTALPVVDFSIRAGTANQVSETDIALPMVAVQALAVTLVSSSRGTNIITANETLTVNVTSSVGVTSITVNGVTTSLVQIITPTEITCVVPLGVGAGYFTNVDVVADNGTPSPGFSAPWRPPLGMLETDFSVAYAGLDVDSPFSGDLTFQDLDALDSCIYDAITAPDSLGVSMDSVGVFTITGTITQVQTFDYYIYDLSDNTVSPTIEQITVQPGPIEVLIGQASETDTARAMTSNIVTTQQIGLATETDTGFPMVDGSIFFGPIGLATETDSAQPVTEGAASQTIPIGQALETDSAFGVVDSSIPFGIIGIAVETDTAFAMVDAAAVRQIIGRATETDSSISVTFPATLDSLRNQLDDLTATVDAQQALIDELYIRMDLNALTPNTYADDGSLIFNDIFTLTKNDNGDGTFNIVRSITIPPEEILP